MDEQQVLQRALFYESQYRTAIVSDAIFFYDVNLSKNIIESDFFLKDEKTQNFISVPTYLGLKPPCRFTEAMDKWVEVMVTDKNQQVFDKIEQIDKKLLEMYLSGKREYGFNYWGLDFSGKKVFYNQRFLLTENEIGEVYGLSILKDLTRIKDYDDSYFSNELKKIAYIDSITGGANYQKIKEDISTKHNAGSIICLDIRSFKTINTLCGISKGNDVILSIWNCIESVIDKENGDLAAHINADQFLIFVNTQIKEKILRLLKELTLSILSGSISLDVPQLNPYFGISFWYPEKSVELTYNEAIVAKNKANLEQIDNYGFFDEKDAERLKNEQNILDDFEPAITKKEFKIWFQPKYDSKNDTLCGAEALVRWIKPNGTIIYPSDFIPVLEKNNKIKELDEYIFRSVCLYQNEWLKKGLKIVPVSVNLSRASLYYNGVVERYKTIADAIKINLKYVPIEITETATITNTQINEISTLFHESGFSLHMDDFGSGYSSLSTLNTINFDTIKLDKSLIDYIGTFNGDRLLVHTISLAKDLGINITAEGVELREQADFLKKHGCDNIQGFFYSEPIDYSAFEQILRNSEPVKKEISESQIINNYLITFIHEFESKDSCFYVINLNKSVLVEYKQYSDSIKKNNLNISIIDDVLLALKTSMNKKQEKCFQEFISKPQIISEFENHNPTKCFEYQSIDKSKWRILRHTFLLDGISDMYCYIKIYRLKK